MNRLLGAGLGLIVFSSACGALRADDKEAQAVIDKAVKAMGGAERLAKAELATWKARLKTSSGGTILTSETTEGSAGRTRIETELDTGNGEASKTLTVQNGDKAWRKQGATIHVLDTEVVLMMKRSRETLDAARRPVILKDPRFLVKMAGEEKVGDRTAVVLEVTGTHGQDFKLSFDKENSLPVKLERKTTLPGGRESSVATTFADYKDFDGIKVATKRQQIGNAPKGSESEITEFKVLEKVAPETFDEPS